MKIHWKTLLACILLPVATGAVAGGLTRGSMETFRNLNQPPLSPPGWLFPVVWTILYVLMGLASYLAITSDAPQEQITAALKIYGLQLAVNFFWSLLFFNLGRYCLAFFWLLLLWVLISINLAQFRAVTPKAAWLLVPYLGWVSFAGYLNLSICLLN
ncbi:TspO/MBR family protein [Oscillibacter sp.]|uniref:TspO/MBR family protein n=1 Tax=Oscillibacter sp. TaxID=1945593 RepID=UPI00262BA1B9|nr:TspO/MBR family protein [Oscillibacter sp.]MDD3347813.1 tryptophan-rich sensory protein [Oscillibacter sp.]